MRSGITVNTESFRSRRDFHRRRSPELFTRPIGLGVRDAVRLPKCFARASELEYVDRGRAAGHPAPPAQIRTCATNASGSCVELERAALVWIRMHHIAGRYPATRPAVEALPCHVAALTAPTQRAQPHPVDLTPHRIQCDPISRNAVVLKIPTDHAAKPAALPRGGRRVTPFQFQLDPLQEGANPFSDRYAAQCTRSVTSSLTESVNIFPRFRWSLPETRLLSLSATREAPFLEDR